MNAKPALVRPSFASDFDLSAALWITRLSLSHSAAISQFNDSIYSEDFRKLIGIHPEEGVFLRTALRVLLKIRASEFEEKILSAPSVLDNNIALLSELLGLSALQSKILAFVAMSHQHQLLSSLVDELRSSNLDDVAKLLACALKESEAEIKQAIHGHGALLQTRIITIQRSDIGRGMQFRLPNGLVNALVSSADNIQTLMGSFLESTPAPMLTEEAFVHVNDETTLLKAYLKGALAHRVPGVNVLIYGPPGTGKTEYVRCLAKGLGQSLYQVRATDNDGEPISGPDRLAFFQLSQRFLQNSPALMLFDEIEDVFPMMEAGERSRGQRIAPGKMYLNALLENNPVPAIWISNEVGHIDKAYLRRFDFSFEMGVPPIAVRRNILANYLHGQRISKDVVSDLASQEALSPAQVEKAAKVLQLAGKNAGNKETVLMCVIENSMSLLDQKTNDPGGCDADACYQLDYLNPDCDLRQLVVQLKRSPKSVGALCFYGPPGTGKTALAHYLAQEMEVSLMARRASDLLSPYVGETEQNIAQMFKQARDASAVLLLDEADSFLSERRSARNTWEVTGVNEMLTQMERFDGLFICSTNLIHRLDTASLRRFALKVKFDYLRSEQRWQLFVAHLKKRSGAQGKTLRATLDTLHNLTPGDFATVRRQAKLLHIDLTAEELLKRLVLESKAKGEGQGRSIGFVQTH